MSVLVTKFTPACKRVVFPLQWDDDSHSPRMSDCDSFFINRWKNILFTRHGPTLNYCNVCPDPLATCSQLGENHKARYQTRLSVF
jgi:hypothetical protein